MSLYTSDLTDLDPARRELTENEVDALDRLTPVAMRLDRALADIPPAVARQGIPLAMVQQRLRGRKGGVAHVGEVSAALLKRGWTRHKHEELRPAGQCETRWYPPGVEPVRQIVEDRPKLPRGRPPKWLAYARQRAKAEGRNI